jgi:hypothetical protein
MARTAAAGFGSLVCACARAARCWLAGRSGAALSLAAGLILFGMMFSGPAQAADPVKGEASFSDNGGYARLVFKLAEDVESEVTTAGSILVIRFKRPVDIPIDRWSEAVPDYVGGARRDPDGSAIRLSLSRRVIVNTMTAGERVFVDLLPDTWTGAPPSLPGEVIRELSERARVAERALRLQRALTEAKKLPPIRVRASVQPTFVRFVFEMPDGVNVSSVLNDQKLTLSFNAVLAFDLADAKVAAPPNIASINQKIQGETSAVDITMIGDVDVHSFRDDKNYIIDVAFQQAQKPSAQLPAGLDPSHAPLAAAPATAIPMAAAAPAPAAPIAPAPAASAKPADQSAAAGQSDAILPPTSETLAKEANIEIKPEAPPNMAPASEAPMSAPVAQETQMAAPPHQEAPAAVAPMPKKTIVAASESPPPETKAGDSDASVDARRDSDGLRLMFSFATATPAALFRRADTV